MNSILHFDPANTAEERLLAAIDAARETLGHRRPAVRSALALARLLVKHPTMTTQDASVAAAAGKYSATVLSRVARGQPEMIERPLRVAAAAASLHGTVSKARPGGRYTVEMERRRRPSY